ncbi:DNA-binding response regulator [Clostridium paraputrificum]|uniref:DNA-binding response regulator n=1 Tax=Clostridium paraputrificum TaxID=29363 RepID=UPI0023308EDA|nr:DNA-binding response regulator [Clostridium paraputrificum]MDB2090458.1 DNA-binding response regulator [Clostridium paraputrificum]MDB2097512.1 DNA-binding response regulator [Clostridium paraputrificum]
MLDKEKVKEMYLKGYSASDIAKKLNASRYAVQKCIQRNMRLLKKSHDIAKEFNKEVAKVTRREAKQYMSDKDFIRRNKSIYKTNENGDIVLNKEVSGIVSFDTPRRFVNEFSNERIDKNIRKLGYRKDEELFS